VHGLDFCLFATSVVTNLLLTYYPRVCSNWRSKKKTGVGGCANPLFVLHVSLGTMAWELVGEISAIQVLTLLLVR
jgi:hypothetical protein